MVDINHADRGHSEIGASSSHRWLNCPASVSWSRGIENKSSKYAIEGTAAHELSEYCIERSVEPETCVGMEFNGFKVNEEMAGFISSYISNLSKYLNDEEYDVFLEEKFSLPHLHPDMYGSNDFCALGLHNEELVIVDLKYGMSPVMAENNMQLVIYALGAYHANKDFFDFTSVKLVIAQPRVEGNEWNEWSITIQELLAYEEILAQGIEEVYSDNPRAESGDHCKYCLAKPTCKVLKNKTEDLIQTSFEAAPIESNTLPEVDRMSKEQIIKVLKYSKTIKDWMDSVAVHALDLLEQGEEIEGYKLVKKRSIRKIKDESEFTSKFKGLDIYRTQLKTLSQLEKIIGKEEIKPFLIKPDTGVQIAPESDKRAAVETRKDLIDNAFNSTDEDFDIMEF